MLLVEYNVLEKVQVITEGKDANQRMKLRGKFQKCDEQNNNGRVYPRKILENQVKAIKEKIDDRSLVGALDHPSNDAIHLSQASHLITNLWVENNGDVMGECEILSTPNGKIVEALLNDGVKIGISSRGLGSVSEGTNGKVVNEDFKLITFDLVSDPSTKGAFPAMSESMRENSQRAQEIVSKHKRDRVLLTMLESKIAEAIGKKKRNDEENVHATRKTSDKRIKRRGAVQKGRENQANDASKDVTIADMFYDTGPQGYSDHLRRRANKARNKTAQDYTKASNARISGQQRSSTEIIGKALIENFRKAQWARTFNDGTRWTPADEAEQRAQLEFDRRAEAKAKAKKGKQANRGKFKNIDIDNQEAALRRGEEEDHSGLGRKALDNVMGGKPKVPTLKRTPVDKNAAIKDLNRKMNAKAKEKIDKRRADAEARNRGESPK